jgi:Ca2+-transporting ATPase
LKKLSVTAARVIRAGTLQSIPARELVPGDLIQVEAGDHVPADARLVYATSLRTQEAALTGESTPIDKMAEALASDMVAIADRHNMIFFGTDIATGKGRALVVATGLQTELGRIATLMQAAEPEQTPLQRRLEQLGHVLLYLSLGIVTIVFVLGLLRGEPLVDMFLTAVSLAVAAIPEGLPAIVTITLALGVTRMVKRHALVRRLPAVETLGSTTVICTDKTGTLTKNEMTVTRLFVDNHICEVTGEGYTPTGEIREERQPLNAERATGVRALLTASVLCNGATLQEENGTWRILGDPTEGALLVAAAKVHLWKEQLEAEYAFLGEVPFDPERKMMTVVRQMAEGFVAYVKGAPDVLLQKCTHYVTLGGESALLTESVCQRILVANDTFAHEALRVLAVAQRPLTRLPSEFRAQELEDELTFLGLMAMKDPLRPEAKAAAAICRAAGIRTVMITGDHKDTATAIARELGIIDGETRALSGAELDRLTDQELAEHVEPTSVYARVSAEHKLRVVRAWKACGAVVAMTGDGVNDAPAVKEADIGVAMGLTGTDVTKEAADLVVTDDNFASIAAAVEEGRGIYENIRKAVHYLLSCNLSEIFLMLFATILFLPLPLLPVQILWINLVTDGFPALALAVDPSDPDLMRRPPRSPTEPVLTASRVRLMFVQGFVIAVVTLVAFVYCLHETGQGLQQARAVAFTVLVMAQLFHAFNCRSDTHSLFRLGVTTNKPLLWAALSSLLLQVSIMVNPWAQTVFGVAPFDASHWLFVVGFGIFPLIAMEAWKVSRRWQDRGTPPQSKARVA